jgi:hypothetical protein
LSFDILSFDILSFHILSFDILSFDNLSFDILNFNISGFDKKLSYQKSTRTCDLETKTAFVLQNNQSESEKNIC